MSHSCHILFSKNYSTVSTKYYSTLKVEEYLVFCNYVIFGVHILNFLKTMFPKLIFHLRLRHQLPDVLFQEFDIHSTYVINHCI